jgi:hypothetical protein
VNNLKAGFSLCPQDLNEVGGNKKGKRNSPNMSKRERDTHIHAAAILDLRCIPSFSFIIFHHFLSFLSFLSFSPLKNAHDDFSRL